MDDHSSEHVVVHIPQAATWLLRLASSSRLALTLTKNPLAFACWYAILGDVLEWPEEALKLIEAERSKKLSMERMLKMLGEARHVFSSRVNSEQAQRALEGYAVNDWARSNVTEFSAMAKNMLDVFEAALSLEERLRITSDPMLQFARNIKQLCETLGLDKLEEEILYFAFLSTASAEVRNVFDHLVQDRWAAERLWTAVFDVDADALAKAVRPNSPLRLSGIVSSGGWQSQMVSVSPFWIELLSRCKNLKEAVVEPLTDKIGSGMPAKLSAEDQNLAIEVLKNSKESGVNLLLYGTGNMEKQQLVLEIAGAAGRKPWRLARTENESRADLPALTYLAFALLSKDTEQPMLVIDKPSDALQSVPSAFMRMMFGIEVDGDIPPFDENLLAHNKVPGLWLSSNVRSMSDETIARFVFHAPVRKADKKERIAALELRLQGLRLTKAAREDILKLEGVSSAQLDSALRASRLFKPVSRKARDATIVQAILRSQRALEREVQSKARVPVTQYSLKYLNASGRFSPQQILDCLARTGKGSLVLYGPPGTGKTQFVEHMALELGKPLVAKRASDLLSKWLGESEKNISAAFEEAANEGAILLLDEGDSFLRSRANAQHSWEVTQVNEMLQAVERFEGIVVVATNLFSGLDAAALRRFTFKIEFCPLDADQRREMFVNETNLKGQLSGIDKKVREDWFDTLCLMRNLCAGDFATVKRQCILLDMQLTPQEWITQLQLEVDVKNKSPEEGMAMMRAM